MTTEPVNALYACVGAFVDELARSGVRDAVVCPGSRSTPLALALAAEQRIHVWMHIDERSAAFFALGLAKRSDRPVALVCTSGTAAANFFPAVVEARLTRVPLVVLTADRPPELRDDGAPQAIDQDHLYGRHAKWYAEAALPAATDAALRASRTLACRAVAEAVGRSAGPVHINLPFREPLAPVPDVLPARRDPLAWEGRPGRAPFVVVPAAVDAPRLDLDVAASVTDDLAGKLRGVILAGPQHAPDCRLPGAILALARELDYPILADPLSGLRALAADDDRIITNYDAFLRDDGFAALAAPEVVLRFGAAMTSKPVQQWLDRHPACQQIVVAPDGWPDPAQQASVLIRADQTAFCRDLMGVVAYHAPNPWPALWRSARNVTRLAMQAAIAGFDAPFEGRVFSELADLMPEEAALVLSNSMPIRDADTFLCDAARPFGIICNRGANGIDGVVSTALGVAAAQEQPGPVVLAIGDLAFYHDLNGLLAAKLHALNLIVVLINNDGGGIFSFLPQADYSEHFEQVFGTPTGLDFAPVIAMYGGTLARPTTWAKFRAAFHTAVQAGGLQVIEVKTDRAANVTLHRAVWQAVGAALRASGVTDNEEAR